MRTRPFWTVLALPDGELVEDVSSPALGRNGSFSVPLSPDDAMPMPYGGEIYFLPGRRPYGKPAPCHETGSAGGRGKPLSSAASAILPPGYLRLLLPAFQGNSKAPPLPFLGFTCVAWSEDRFWVAAHRTDDTRRWDPSQYHTPNLPHLIRDRLKRHPENRLLPHLAQCALDYGCYNAQNIFYERWEGGIPISPACNSACRGCISFQPSKRPPSPQDRISFVPSVEEMTEVVLHHLESAPEAIASFGQGCEGEPLLHAGRIAEVIRLVRSGTDRGTLNMNTNGSLPEAVKMVAEAGLDSLRVSLNSAVPEHYHRYYRPGRYRFEDVVASISIAKEAGLFVSLNLLVFPGITDRMDETEALLKLVHRTEIDMIQLRNLNMDPDLYLASMGFGETRGEGLRKFLEILKQEAPGVRTGNFSPALK